MEKSTFIVVIALFLLFSNDIRLKFKNLTYFLGASP